MRLFAIVCATVCSFALPAFCQEAQPTPEKNLSFREIQEMLDRFSDTTMRSIEEQLRTKLDEYENAMEESRVDDVAQPDSPVTYRLTFTISGASAPMSILATPGEYSLEAETDDEETVENSRTMKVDSATLRCEGIVQPGPGEGVRVEYEGVSQLRRTEVSQDSKVEDNSSIAFAGSANLPLGQEQEIASNDDLRIVLRVDEVGAALPAERPAAR